MKNFFKYTTKKLRDSIVNENKIALKEVEIKNKSSQNKLYLTSLIFALIALAGIFYFFISKRRESILEVQKQQEIKKTIRQPFALPIPDNSSPLKTP